MVTKDSEAGPETTLSVTAEAVLIAMGVQQRYGGPQAAAQIMAIAALAEVSETACWKTVSELQEQGLVRAFDAGPGKSLSNTATLTEAGNQALSRLNVVPPRGPVTGFFEGLQEAPRVALDAAVEHELQYEAGSATRSQLRTIVRNTIKPRPDIETANLAILELVDTHLTVLSGDEPSYRVTLRGLLASRWGQNFLEVISQTLELLSSYKLKDPALRRYSWTALRKAFGLSRGGLNLAYLAITHAKLGPKMFRAEGDNWWTVPPDLDVVLEVESALAHVQSVIDEKGAAMPHRPGFSSPQSTTATTDSIPMSKAPKVFVSYSHDDDTHKAWVLKLAERLREAGIDAGLDQWDLGPGQDLAHFMERAIADSHRVVMVCSEHYVAKANEGKGGVGYEKMIVTKEIVANSQTNRFIPVIRRNPRKETPAFMGARLYVDFSDDPAFDSRLEELLRELHAVPKVVKPPLGRSPFLAQGKSTAITEAQQPESAQSTQVRADIALALNYEKKPNSTGETHWYDLIPSFRNAGTKRFDDWQIEVQFPTPLLDGTDHACRIAGRSNKRRTTFLVDGRTDGSSIYPGETKTLRFGYLVNEKIYEAREELFREKATVRVFLNGEMVAELEHPIQDLQRF